jgi:hypothetical protein
MTAEEGLNLAGVETVLEMEAELERSKAELAKLRERAAELEKQVEAGEKRVSAARAEIVPYGKYETEGIDTGQVRADSGG